MVGDKIRRAAQKGLSKHNTPFFSKVMEKLLEAEFFFEKMKSVESDTLQLRFYFSAFISAARSVTFVLQDAMGDISGFKEWYSDKREKLKQDPLAWFLHNRRTEAIHKGNTDIGLGVLSSTADGRLVLKCYFTKSIQKRHYKPVEIDVVSASYKYLNLIRELVNKCKVDFASEIDPDAALTLENLREKNMSIEDIEEQLGFPRGWTEGIPDEERLRLLKEQL